jgi:hypothetical protein
MPEGVLQFTPGCGSGCEAGCEIITMDPPSALPGDFTFPSGDWDYVTTIDEALVTEDSNARAIHNATVPSGTTRLFIQYAGGFAFFDAARLIFAWTDSSNYWYVEVILGSPSGTIKIFEVASGSPTQRGSTGTIDEPANNPGSYSVEVCIHPEVIQARIRTDYHFADLDAPPPTEGTDYIGTPPALAGTKIGVGTGTIATAGGYFWLLASVIDTESDDDACRENCWPLDLGGGDCDDVTECCHVEGWAASLVANFTSDALSSNISPCGGDSELTNETLTKVSDLCADLYPSHDATRYIEYRSGTLSPALCGSNNVSRISVHCCSTFDSPNIESFCPQSLVTGFAYLAAHGSFGGTVSDPDIVRLVALTIIDCDPFHAESADGKIVITE